MGDLAKTSGRVKRPLAVRVQSLPDSTRCQLPVTAASTANRFCEHMLTSTCAVNQTYHPSPWEAHWRANIEMFSDGTTRWARGCGHLEGKEAEIEQWLAVAARRGMGSATAWSEDVLSYHEHIDCHGRRWKVPLEPLVGLLRHPRFHCLKMQRSKVDATVRDAVALVHEDRTLLGAKEYLLPTWRDELPSHPRSASSLFFDLGASTYTAGAGGASTSWFVEQYARRGLTFDRIFAWEAKVTPPTHIFGAPMPLSVVDALSYYNVPLETRKGARHNPLRTLSAVARPSDFVVMKIDFDSPAIEADLIEQILSSALLVSLVDELYFEHHTRDNPAMRYKYCWTKFRGPFSCELEPGYVGAINATLHESYELFTRLRNAGIRAHSWV